MSNPAPEFQGIKPGSFLHVNSFDIDLHKFEQEDTDDFMYHPVITLEVALGQDPNTKEPLLSLIVLDTAIFCEDPVEAVYHAAQTGFYLTESYKSEVFVFEDFEKIEGESYTVEDAMNSFSDGFDDTNHTGLVH